MSLGNCQLSDCNARNTKKIVLETVICYLLFVICNAKNSFSETVILLYCNAWWLMTLTCPCDIFQ